MEHQSRWLMLCTGLWTVAMGVTIYATMTGYIQAALWAVMVGLAASVSTGKVIADCAVSREAARVEDIARIVASEMIREEELHSVR